jgi:hypothetical protein
MQLSKTIFLDSAVFMERKTVAKLAVVKSEKTVVEKKSCCTVSYSVTGTGRKPWPGSDLRLSV